jgi:hypothetical protein
MSDEIVVIRKYTSEVEAQVAQIVLEAHDIPSALLRDDAGGMIPSMRLIYPVRLAVRAEDEEEALRVLSGRGDAGEEGFDADE